MSEAGFRFVVVILLLLNGLLTTVGFALVLRGLVAIGEHLANPEQAARERFKAARRLFWENES